MLPAIWDRGTNQGFKIYPRGFVDARRVDVCMVNVLLLVVCIG
jgi:hypothetical protein